MIISRTPFRISFFGGGTDYPAWYREHGGSVVAATIDKYCYLTCRYLPPFFEHRIQIVYSQIERCQSVAEIRHPAARGVLEFLKVNRGLEIHHDGDLPARSGMGSSSAFTVGLLHAMHALSGRMVHKHQLALEGIYIEQEVLRETVGSQDQVMAAYGGLNHVTFLPSGGISVRPITIPAQRIQELNSHLMLFYTGIVRTASEIAQTYRAGTETHNRQMRIMKDLVEESLAILNSDKNINAFGALLHEGWQVKRSLSSSVSSPIIEEMYETALQTGAVGGKILGAGGGGFLLLFVAPENQPRVRERFSRLLSVPFKFEYSGSQVIFHEPEQDYSGAEEDRSGRRIEPFREIGEPTAKPDDGLVQRETAPL